MVPVELKLQDGFDPALVKALIDIMDDMFDHAITPVLKNTRIYVTGGKKDALYLEIVGELEKRGMVDHVNFFKDERFETKEIVSCIDDGRSGIGVMIVKVNVSNGNGYKTLSVVHFIKRFMEIFQERGVIRKLEKDEECTAINEIMYRVPERVSNTEIVTLGKARNDFVSYII